MRKKRKDNLVIGIILSIILLFIVTIILYYYSFSQSSQNVKNIISRGKSVKLKIDTGISMIINDEIVTTRSLLTTSQPLESVSREELQLLEDVLDNRIMIFHDEFDGDILNPDYWTIVEGDIRNNEKQTYSESAIKLENGIAKITARRDSTVDSNYEWVSGEFETGRKLAFQNCRMEAKIRMDNEIGFCPAFWTLGDSVHGWGWSQCGEVDIFETPHLNVINCNNHFANKEKEHKTWGTSQKENVDLTQWHIYAMEVNNGIITIYFDGEQIDWFDSNQMEYYCGVNPFVQPMFPIFNIAVGGTASEGEPDDSVKEVSMEIDWFRVYSNEGRTEEDIIPQKLEMKYLGNDDIFSDGKLKVGDCIQLFPVYVPQNSIQSGIVSCKVENPNICTCNAGYITALHKGKTTVTITDSCGLQDTFEIEVIE